MAFSLKDFVSDAPEVSGVYQMKDDLGEIIYVGKAKNLKKRLANYLNFERANLKTQRLIALIRGINLIKTPTEIDALILEAELIKKYKPRYNILLKDDKSFPYLYITNDEFPKITVHRGSSKNGSLYGPFISGQGLRSYIEELTKIFNIRTCTNRLFANRMRPCLRYYIKRCSAPCVKKISKEDYLENVLELKSFLDGHKKSLIKRLEEKMYTYSDEQKYENAAVLRNRIQIIQDLIDNMGSQLQEKIDVDFIFLDRNQNLNYIRVFGFERGLKASEEEFIIESDEKTEEVLNAFIMQYYINRIPKNQVILNQIPLDVESISNALSYKFKKNITIGHPKEKNIIDVFKMLYKTFLISFKNHLKQFDFEKLQNVLKLTTPINRVEIYDNSHLHGTYPYGGVVSLTPAGLDKRSCKAYKFKSDITGGNDYEYLEKTLNLRLQEPDMPLPQLFIIDGGIAQLNVAVKILGNLNIPILAISKGEDRKSETFFPTWMPSFKISDDKGSLFLLQRLRDYAHNFIIGVHRFNRNHKTKISDLDNIKGIGAKKKKLLLSKFGTIFNISNATKESLMSTGISKNDADNIIAYFSNTKN